MTHHLITTNRIKSSTNAKDKLKYLSTYPSVKCIIVTNNIVSRKHNFKVNLFTTEGKKYVRYGADLNDILNGLINQFELYNT